MKEGEGTLKLKEFMINTLIRWWYLLFYKKRCVQIMLENDWYDIGHLVYANYTMMKYLGKNWYLILKKK